MSDVIDARQVSRYRLRKSLAVAIALAEQKEEEKKEKKTAHLKRKARREHSYNISSSTYPQVRRRSHRRKRVRRSHWLQGNREVRRRLYDAVLYALAGCDQS